MPRNIFMDTSGWISYSLRGEQQHSSIKTLVSTFIQSHVRMYTSNDVIDETVTRLVTHTNTAITKQFVNFFESSIREEAVVQLWTDEQVQAEAIRLVEKYSDHRLSLTDATSAVLMKRFHIETILTLDSDFTKIGVSVLP